MQGALTRYRIIAWIVGVVLILLVVVGMPLKYLADNASVVEGIYDEPIEGWVGQIQSTVSYAFADCEGEHFHAQVGGGNLAACLLAF